MVFLIMNKKNQMPNYFLYIVLNSNLIWVAIFPYELYLPLNKMQLSKIKFISALKSASES